MSTKKERKTNHGLTLRQWSVLFCAFMLGVGGVFVLREIFPPQAAHAAVIKHVHKQDIQEQSQPGPAGDDR
jgi:hypothetical protein